MDPTGRWFGRGEPGYEEARRATVWNARVPDRYPDLVVQATSVADVQAAVRHAGAHGMRIGVRSGGHSWAANHVRDGGLLLDVSGLDRLEVDRVSMTATVGPGRKGHEMCAALAAEDLFFPAGHCRGVAVGGYLLQGGYGWNGRVLGPACESVLGIDVVTADGAIVHADAENNSELFWAARGAGPGFFGVVTRFHVRVYERPAVCGFSLYAYPIELLEDVYRWAHAIGPDVDRRVEMQILMSASFAALGIDRPAIVIASPVFADSEEEARAALALLETCPVRDRALIAVPYAPAQLPDWYDAVMHAYPDEHRYATDNMWTSAPVDDLLPGLKSIADTLPPAPSHVLWLNWGPSPRRQDMAYSVEDNTYIALYGVWSDAADDGRYADWARSHMAAMAPHASGIQLADENLGQRPARFASDTAMLRLDRARADYDPDNRFHSWMGRP
ncbi:FAD-binding oxidoreductase [Streptomyces herbicida]|uniref:FAD-binding oxidoreductase n=1 Tax=Streptomyces herbicida TaxID=3065675 RepID=UPI002931D605|nr:FAD-binding oxidoreductase [Streptomyces sp. NEAU-HV9]